MFASSVSAWTRQPTRACSVSCDENHVAFTVVHDRAGSIEQLYRTVGVPETYLVSGDGVLRWHHVGNLHPVIDDARNAIQAAITRSR